MHITMLDMYRLPRECREGSEGLNRTWQEAPIIESMIPAGALWRVRFVDIENFREKDNAANLQHGKAVGIVASDEKFRQRVASWQAVR